MLLSDSLTVEGDLDSVGDWLRVVVVVPDARELGCRVLPLEHLHLHRVSGLAGGNLLEDVVNQVPVSPPGYSTRWPAYKVIQHNLYSRGL